LSVEVDAPRRRGLVKIRLPRAITEGLNNPEQSTPQQAQRGLELAVECKRAEPLKIPRGRILQGVGGEKRLAPAFFIPQESDCFQL
jgi:hypothetical protein